MISRMVYDIYMKSRARRLILTFLVAGLSLSCLQAGRAFDVLHDHYRKALEDGEIIRAINLYKPISMRMYDLRNQLLYARHNGMEEEAAELEATIRNYSRYLVTREEAERMGILREQTTHPEKLEEASIFLYENTDFFRPSITIKDELGIDSQIHVWLAKPGSEISFEHEYDTSKLNGRIFTGYMRESDGAFKKGEAPTFPMSYDSEVWIAVYEYGCVYVDKRFEYEIFYPADETGMVRIPQLSWISSDYSLAGWRDTETGRIVAPKDAREIRLDEHSLRLEPVWESVDLELLHLGNRRKTMKHGSRENFHIDIASASDTATSFLVTAEVTTQNAIAQKVFEFVTLEPGEHRCLGPYSIEALMGSGRETATFLIRIKALDSGNEWTYTPEISIR